MLIVGLILLVVAIGCFLLSKRSQKHLRTLQSVPTVPCSDVAQHAAAARLCEVEGSAIPGPEGLLVAPFSQRQCLWYRAEVRERFWQSNGNDNQRYEQTRTVSDDQSDQPFGVADQGGRVLIQPREASFDDVEESFDQFEPSNGPLSTSFGIGVGIGNNAPGFERREWIVTEGQHLFVSGQANRGSRGPEMIKPENGRLLVSTRTEEQLSASTARNGTILTIIAAVAGVAGLVFLALGVAG